VTSARDASPTGTATPLRGGAQIAVAVGIMNVATYGYTILAARMLGPGSYGAVAAVMNLLMVLSVAALALQAAAARRIAAETEHVAQIERTVLRTGRRAGLAIGLVLLALSPLVDRLLRLDDLRVALLVAVTAVPLTVVGGQSGVLQGERRWAALGAVYVAAGVPRLALGAVLLTWRPSELTAVVAVALGSLAPVAVGWWALRAGREPGPVAEHHGGRAILRESVLNSQALLAFFALSNLDVVVARNALDPHASGLYAAGLILTKAMLFLPQFVVVLAFPTMAIGRRAGALALGILTIGGLGGVGMLACWLLPDLALTFIGGDAFAGIRDELWTFALLGTVLAILQLLVYSVLARDGRGSSVLLWVALVAVLLVGATADSAAALVARVVTVDGCLLVALLVTGWRGRSPRPEPA
jgi:O-antigen/teichoic acid export membrane protein